MNSKMRKGLALVLTLAFAVTLMAGCGGNKSENTPAAVEATKAEDTRQVKRRQKKNRQRSPDSTYPKRLSWNSGCWADRLRICSLSMMK